MAYTVLHYCAMVSDRLRADAYRRALEAAVRPGDVVVDIGTGLGTFALLAARLGARRVYAVEPNPAIELARALARANGLEDRIEFFPVASTEVDLPERADVVLSDLRGALPLCGRHLPAIADARARFLAPGGTMIPLRDTVFAAPVECPELYGRSLDASDEDHFGLDVAAVRHVLANTVHQGADAGVRLLAAGAAIREIDYAGALSPHVEARPRWRTGGGTLHGFRVWFDTVLAHDVTLTNAPDAPPLAYGFAFLPLSRPVPVEEGEPVGLHVRAHLVGDEYVWAWDVVVGDVPSEGAPAPRFEERHSTLQSALVDPAALRRGAASYRGGLAEHGRIARHVLSEISAGRSLGEIAADLAARHPDRFATDADALARVGELARRYAE